MKTEITPEEYINIYEGCDWNPKAFSIILKRLGYSDELIVNGDLDLEGTPIQSLGNLKTVRGWLDLEETPIQDLGNLQKVGTDLDLRRTSIQDLGNLQHVGGSLWLTNCTNLLTLGNLKKVGGFLDLENTPLSKKYSEKEIREMIDVMDDIYL